LNPFVRLVFLLTLTLCAQNPGAAQIVVHEGVAQQQLDVEITRQLFTLRVPRWADGTHVRVLVLPDAHPLHREFCKGSLNLYPRQLRRVWERHLYSGAGAMPIEVGSVEVMRERVAETPGAIGYLPDGAAVRGVRVLHVD
jgi:hypothetical protein